MDDTVDDEIRRRLRAQRMRGDFGAIHAAPGAPGDVPDVASARLVVLGPEHPHTDGDEASPACTRAAELLASAGPDTPRHYLNMLVFVAADAAALDALRPLVAASDAAAQPAATWTWLLAPAAGGQFAVSPAPGSEDLAMRVSRRLRADGTLIVDYPPARLRADLDAELWPAGADHVALADVWEVYATSLGLPRLRSSATLAAAVVGGVAAPDWETRTFAYAAGWDAEHHAYVGLLAGHRESFALSGSGLIVRPSAARAQIDADS